MWIYLRAFSEIGSRREKHFSCIKNSQVKHNKQALFVYRNFLENKLFQKIACTQPSNLLRSHMIWCLFLEEIRAGNSQVQFLVINA